MIEMLVVLAVSGIVLSISAPSLLQSVARNRLAVSTSRVLMALGTARLTAVSRNTSVTFCAGNLVDGCTGQWSSMEWIVFLDHDNNGKVDSADEVRIFDSLTLTPDMEISGNGPFRKTVIFKPGGTAETATGAFAAGRLRICVNRSIPMNANDLVLIGSGRAEAEPRDFSGSCPTAGP